jgi:hypothetical protein
LQTEKRITFIEYLLSEGKMKPKRPRITSTRSYVDRQENNILESDLTGKTAVTIEDKAWSKGKLPDIEMDELWQKGSYEPIPMLDYQIETDLIPGEKSIEPQDASTSDIPVLKDIYNTIDFNQSL